MYPLFPLHLLDAREHDGSIGRHTKNITMLSCKNDNNSPRTSSGSIAHVRMSSLKRDKLMEDVPSIVETRPKPRRHVVVLKSASKVGDRKTVFIGDMGKNDESTVSMGNAAFNSLSTDVTRSSSTEDQQHENASSLHEVYMSSSAIPSECGSDNGDMSDLEDTLIVAESQWVINAGSDAADIAFGSGLKDKADDKRITEERFHVWFLEVAIVAVIIVLTIVSVTILTMKRMEHKASRSVPNATTLTNDNNFTSESFNNHTGVSPTIRNSAYFNLLRDTLSINPNPSSPQYQALEWLTYDDYYFYYDNVSQMNELIQRYALVVFHIATGRWNNGGGWATPSGARQPTCYWTGVICNRGDKVVYGIELDYAVGLLTGTIPPEIGLLTSLGRCLNCQHTIMFP